MSKINFKVVKKKSIFVLAGIILILAGIFGVYAYIPNPGHNLLEINPPNSCLAESLLNFAGNWYCQHCSGNDKTFKSFGDGWDCVDISSLITPLWVTDSNGIHYNGVVGLNAIPSSSALFVNGKANFGGGIQIGHDPDTPCNNHTQGMLKYTEGCWPSNEKQCASELRTCRKVEYTGNKSGTFWEWKTILRNEYDEVTVTPPTCVPKNSNDCWNRDCGFYNDGCGGSFSCGSLGGLCPENHYCSKYGHCLSSSRVVSGVGWSSGGGCFLAGTKVLMADGNEKNIEEIQAGEFVLSFDVGENKFIESEVKKLLTHTKENTRQWERGYLIIKTKNENEIKVTSNHPIYNLKIGKYARADAFNVGDLILVENSGQVLEQEISSISFIEKNLEVVYNLELDSAPHNYFANRVLVHNLKAAYEQEGCEGCVHEFNAWGFG